MEEHKADMPAAKVIDLVQLLNQNRIEVIIDGGWGVDALLGEQTRPHEDLDLAVFHEDVPKIRSLFEVWR
jgi:lincosamide nucleotidyltransferase A/C/D/E